MAATGLIDWKLVAERQLRNMQSGWGSELVPSQVPLDNARGNIRSANRWKAVLGAGKNITLPPNFRSQPDRYYPARLATSGETI